LAHDAAIGQKGPALRVVAKKPSDIVALFARATSPPGIRLLAESFLATIKAVQINVIPL
jgi:hypothetical protein